MEQMRDSSNGQYQRVIDEVERESLQLLVKIDADLLEASELDEGHVQTILNNPGAELNHLVQSLATEKGFPVYDQLPPFGEVENDEKWMIKSRPIDDETSF